MVIAHNIAAISNQLPARVTLICVSKYHPIEAIKEAYNAGQRHFGESRVQELVKKQAQLPQDIVWHYIGHIQTNKIKQLLPLVSFIHGVDSVNHLLAIDSEAKKTGKVVSCLLQVHIAQEDSKFGFSEDELLGFLQSNALKVLQNTRICGLMGMATYTTNTEQIRTEFAGLQQLFEQLKRSIFVNNDAFCELSMGMSDDYPIAIEAGSTMVRIGSRIFGPRI